VWTSRSVLAKKDAEIGNRIGVAIGDPGSDHIAEVRMKRNGPMVTLLAGICLAVLFFLLSMRVTRDVQVATPSAGLESAGLESVTAVPSARTETAGDTPSAAPQISRVPLAAPAQITATWAGYLEVGTIALSAKKGTMIAYVCDGERIEAWLKGTAEGGKLNLTGAKGASLTGSYTKDRASGTVTIGARTFDFSVKAVAKPSGLYRAASEVSGAKVVGGWIVLPDGSQVGLGTVDGAVREASGLDPSSGTATIGGVAVRATRTEGVG
jgi:hypothetical protein